MPEASRYCTYPDSSHLIGGDAADQDTTSVSARHDDGTSLAEDSAWPTACRPSTEMHYREIQPIVIVPPNEDTCIADFQGEAHSCHVHSCERSTQGTGQAVF